MRTRACWALLLSLLASATARAEDEIGVLPPTGGPGATARHLERVAASLAMAVREQPHLEVAARSVDAACAADVACLARTGAELGVARIVGVVITPAARGVDVGFLLVDVIAAREAARQTRRVAEKDLAREAGTQLLELLLMAPPITEPPAPRPSAGSSPATTPTSPAEPAVAPPATGPHPAPESPGWPGTPSLTLGAYGGVVVPLELAPGGIGGVELGLALLADRVTAAAGVDLAMLADREVADLHPPTWPRSRGSLGQTTWLVVLRASARYQLLTLPGRGAVFVGGGLGLSLDRTELEAYGTSHPDRGVAPLGLLEAGVRLGSGRIGWSLTAGWRQGLADTGIAGARDGLTGLLVTLGAAYSP